MNDELALRPGVAVAHALDSLKSLARDANNLASGGLGLGGLLNQHLAWVETAEMQLRHLFTQAMVWQELYSDRYWHLRDLAVGRAVRGEALITGEARWQAERLEGIVRELDEARQLFELPNDQVAIVPDTNVFMHYERYHDIDWPGLIDAGSVRLVVPLVVIDELDDLSFRSRENSDRARGVIRALRHLRGDSAPEVPVPVRAHVHLQLLVDPPGHRRRPSNDDEILARAEYLAGLVDNRVSLASGDYGMQLRATGRGLRCVLLPDELRL